MWKAILIGLLLVGVFSQIMLVQDVKKILDSNHAQSLDGYEAVPTDNLDSLHAFIKKIVQTSYPGLSNWTLVQILQKSDNETSQVIYIYSYIKIVQINGQSKTNITDIKVIPVVNSQQNYFTIFEGNQTIDTYLRQSAPARVGGFQQGDVNSLDTIQQDALNFTLTNVDYLSNWELVSIKTQIVAGQRICFIFKDPKTNKTEQMCVVSQPWLNFMELTLPDGTKITQGSQTPPHQPSENNDTPPPPPTDESNLTQEPSPNNQTLPQPPSTDSIDPQPSDSDSVPSS